MFRAVLYCEKQPGELIRLESATCESWREANEIVDRARASGFTAGAFVQRRNGLSGTALDWELCEHEPAAELTTVR